MINKDGVDVKAAPDVDPVERIMGIRDEKKEHADTYRWLEDFVRDTGKLPSIDAFAEQIALNHLLNVDPHYYSKLKKAKL